MTFGAIVGYNVVGAISKVKQKGGAKSKYSDDEKREMLEKAVLHGWSGTEAGKEFNVSTDTIRNWAKDLGIVLAKVRSSDCSHCGT